MMNIMSSLFTIVCALVLPIGAAVYLCIRRNGVWKPLIFGALTFFVFQVLIRIPIIQIVLPNMQWFLTMSYTQPVVYALFMGVTAALVEEFGRYVTMRLFLKKNLRFVDGISFGIGHGGIEAILIAGIGALMLLLTDIGSVKPVSMFAGGFERISAMICHVGWSVMVMKSVRGKKTGWLLLAFATHTILDTFVGLAAYMGMGIWLTEAVLMLFAVLMIVYIIYEFKKGDSKK